MHAPAQLTPPQRKQLTRLLLACGSIRDREQRVLVLEDLSLERAAGNEDDDRALLARVTDLVTRCSEQPGGISGLLEVVRFYEGDTRAMTAIDRWLEDMATSARGSVRARPINASPGSNALDSEDTPHGAPGLLGSLHGVPELPLPFLERRRDMTELVQVLCTQESALVGVTAAHSAHRLGGIGKTALAAAAARSMRVRARFADGIYWLRLGREPDISAAHRRLARYLDMPQRSFDSPAAGKQALRQRLADQRVLLVLDDVRAAEHASWLDVVGQHGRVLVTARSLHAWPGRDPVVHALDAFSLPEARALLAAWVDTDIAALPDEASDVADACARLPLALAVAGALARAPGASWSGVLEQLMSARLAGSRGRIPGYPYRGVYRAIEAGLAHLAAARSLPAADACYADLAVFADDEDIPGAAIGVLFRRHGLDSAQTLDLCRALSGHGLATMIPRSPWFSLRMHDLQRAYARARAADPMALHSAFIDAFAARCPAGERALERGPASDADPDERAYFFKRLPHHLIEAGRGDELHALLASYLWLDGKLRAAGATELVRDFERLPLDAERDHGLQLIRDALRLSSQVLAQDVEQLAMQLVGRLGHFEHRDPVVRALLDDARRHCAHPWLCPIRPNLTPPGGPLLYTFLGHSARVFAVALSADGSRALSGSDDRTARLWDTRTGALLHTFEDHSSWVRAVALSADGTRALTGSDDQSIKLWSTRTGALLHTFHGHTWSVRAVALSADGRRALSGSLDQTVKFWDTGTGALLHTLSGHTDWVNAVALSADGTRALSGSLDQTVKLWDTRTGARLRTFEAHQAPINAVALDAAGVLALSGSADGAVLLWDTRNGAVVRQFEGHAGEVFAVALSADGRRGLSGSMDHTVRFWDARQSAPARTFEGHALWVNAVALSADGTRALSGADDQMVKLWDTERGAHTFEGHAASVLSVALSADGTRALSGSLDQTIKLWDTRDGALSRTFEGHSCWVDSVALSADGTRALSGSDDRTVRFWDAERGVLIRTFEGHDARVRAVALSADGTRALSGSDDHTLKLWDTRSGTLLRTFAGHTDWVRAVALSADGTRALSGADDRTVNLWDPVRGTLACTFEGHDAEVVAVSLSADGKRALSGALDHTVKLWDTRRGTLLHTFEGHLAEVVAVSLSADGRLALSGSLDHTVKLWDAETGHLILTATMDWPILACSLFAGPERTLIIIGDQAGHVHMMVERAG